MTSQPPSDLPITAADFATAAPLPVEGEPVPVESPARQKPPSLWSYPATYILMGVNIVVYLLMFRYGPVLALVKAHLYGQIVTAGFDPNVLLYFGGCDAALVLKNDQWYRVLTACFVHGSLLHIMLNMWCLWNLGVFGEPLLGRRGLISIYLLTGISGNLLSLGWTALSLTGPLDFGTANDSIVVGASGAVFGIAGILIILLSNRKLSLPWKELRSLRGQVIFFAVANLAIGLVPRVAPIFSANQLQTLHIDPSNLPNIDNSAHLGGFLAGLALGLPLFPRMTSGKQSYRQRQLRTYLASTLILCLIAYALKAFAKQ